MTGEAGLLMNVTKQKVMDKGFGNEHTPIKIGKAEKVDICLGQRIFIKHLKKSNEDSLWDRKSYI